MCSLCESDVVIYLQLFFLQRIFVVYLIDKNKSGVGLPYSCYSFEGHMKVHS